MKSIGINKERGQKRIYRFLMILLMAVFGGSTIFAQNSLPAPGSGGSFNPAPIGGSPGGLGGGPGMGLGSGPGNMGNPILPPGPGWGNQWGSSWNSPSWTNQGITNVIACGYDFRGIWRTIPLNVAYTFNGADYNVTVLAAYNPWTQQWNNNLSTPAYETAFYLRGTTYDYFVNLSTGTYYFNL